MTRGRYGVQKKWTLHLKSTTFIWDRARYIGEVPVCAFAHGAYCENVNQPCARFVLLSVTSVTKTSQANVGQRFQPFHAFAHEIKLAHMILEELLSLMHFKALYDPLSLEMQHHSVVQGSLTFEARQALIVF